MPVVETAETQPLVTPFGRVQPEETDTASFLGAAQAAIELENDAYAVWEAVTRQRHPPEEGFNWFERAKRSPYALDYGDQLIRAQSTAEFDQIEARIKRQHENQQALASLGWFPALALGLISGGLSPTMAIPLVGQARGAKGVMQAFALAAAGATAQETTLFLSQETRTPEEFMVGVGAGTILGGLLGSSAVYLRNNAKNRIVNEWTGAVYGDDMAPAPGVATISIRNPEGAANLSAAESKLHPDPGRLKGVYGEQSVLEAKTVRLNPVGRLITDQVEVGTRIETRVNEDGELVEVEVDTPVRVEEGEEFARGMSDMGMKFTENEAGVPTVKGGNVENRRVRHGAPLVKAIHALDESYMRYIYGEEVNPGVFGVNKLMAQLRSGARLLPKGKLTLKQFNEEITWALNTGDKSPSGIKQVDDAAKAIRENVVDYFEEVNARYLNEMKERFGVDAQPLFVPRKERIDPETGEVEESHFWHVFDPEKISARGLEFDTDLTQWVQTRLEASFREAYERHLKEMEALEDAAGKGGIKETKSYKKALKERKKELATIRRDMKKLKKKGDAESLSLLESLRPQSVKLKSEVDFLRRRVNSTDKAVRQRVLEDVQESLEDWLGASGTKLGGVDIDIKAGEGDFSIAAVEIAKKIATNIRGDHARVTGIDMLGAERGVELSRMLNMPYHIKQKYLITDPEKIIRIAGRQLATDLEMKRMYGSVNASGQLQAISDRYDKLIEQVNKSGGKRTGIKGAFDKLKKNKEISQDEINQRVAAIRKQKERALEDAQTLVSRMRHQRGIPKNPSGFLYRMGRVAMNAQVASMMGMVTASSIPDLGRPVMKFGALKAYRDGFKEFATQSKRWKMAKDQAELMGIAVDPVLHNRLHAMFDLFDVNVPDATLFERGVEYLANKTGLVGMFDQWTALMKNVTFSIATAEISRGIRLLQTGAGTATERKIYTEMLASAGLDADLQDRIWRQLANGNGGTQFGDNWLPNIENWTDPKAADAYAAALGKLAEMDTIITPGVARASWMDENMAFRMLAQFRSFTADSTNKTLLAGLQDAGNLDARGMAVAQGTLFSLALGSLSYYTHAMATGGETWEKAKNASLGTIADEAIDRSGLLGWYAELMRIMDKVPATSGYLRLGDQGVTRRGANDLWGTALGPTGSTVSKMFRLATQIDSPTKATAHIMRTMLPYQNIFYWRRVLTAVEEALASPLPEKREAQ